MQQLVTAASIPNTLRTVTAQLTLLGWHLFVTYILGVGAPNLRLCHRILRPLIANFPNVCLFYAYASA